MQNSVIHTDGRVHSREIELDGIASDDEDTWARKISHMQTVRLWRRKYMGRTLTVRDSFWSDTPTGYWSVRSHYQAHQTRRRLCRN